MGMEKGDNLQTKAFFDLVASKKPSIFFSGDETPQRVTNGC